MKGLLALVLLAGMSASAGCVTTAPLEPLAPLPTPTAKTLPPVTPEQITDKNGHQVAQALEEEINREQQQNILTTTPR
jgi:hypothetical protein